MTDEPLDIDRLLGYRAHAEYELDLRGLDWLHAEASLERMLERSRFRPPRSVLVLIDPATEGGGETLFQPVGRYLLAARRKGLLTRLSPLPADKGAGYYMVMAGRPSDEDGDS